MVETKEPTANTGPDGKENIHPPVRRSSRKRAKTIKHAPEELASGRGRSTGKKKTGRLSQLMNMPMDILMEIFGHLHPFDLLHLARTTKAFRRVLMHKSSVSVWKASRSNVLGFPECPPDLSEPQWANLAFDPYCHFCYRPNIRTVDWRLRVRLCLDCTRKQIVDWVDHYEDAHLSDIVSITPHRYGKRAYREFLRSDYLVSREQYLAIDDPAARRAFVKDRRTLIDDVSAHADLCERWAENQALDRSVELSRLKQSRCKSIIGKLTALGWGDEIDKIPIHRFANHKLVKTPQLLTERIWKNISQPLIEYMEQEKAQRLARELIELKVARKLLAINELRTYKIANAPFTAVMPEAFDFCSFEPINEIVDRPSDVEINAESFLPVVPQIDNVVKEWRKHITVKFLEKIQVDTAEENSARYHNDKAKLVESADGDARQKFQLARTVYKCTCCKDTHNDDLMYLSSPLFDALSALPLHTGWPESCNPLWYPRVLAHRCLTKPTGFDFRADGAMRLRTLPWHRIPWSCLSIEIDNEASEIAASVIEACGMDPAVATADDMDMVDTRLECLECLESNSYHTVFGWRSAVKHQCENHPMLPGVWEQLTPEQIAKSKIQEDKWIREFPDELKPSNQICWLCMRCLDSPDEISWADLETVETHIRLMHDVPEPAVDVDYVKDFAAPELYRSCVLFETSMHDSHEL